MTDPFSSQSVATIPAPGTNPFGFEPDFDPFAPLATFNYGPAPRIADLEGRLLALRLRRMEDRPKFQGTGPDETEIAGVVDIAVLDGGMIYGPPEKDAPFGTPMRECGEAPATFTGRFVSNKGILNKFPAVNKMFMTLPSRLGAAVDFPPNGAVILGRLGRLPKNKAAAKHLGLKEPMTEEDLNAVTQWLATNPSKEQIDGAGLFRTIVSVSGESHARAIAWARDNRDFFE